VHPIPSTARSRSERDRRLAEPNRASTRLHLSQIQHSVRVGEGWGRGGFSQRPLLLPLLSPNPSSLSSPCGRREARTRRERALVAPGAPSASEDTALADPDVMEKDEQKEKQPGEEQSGDAEEKMNRKLSCTTVDEDGGDEDEEEKGPVELGPQIGLKEQLEMDKDDESLRKWKEQLLGSIDLNEVGETLEPDVKIQDLTILAPDRPDVVLPIPFVPDAKGFAFALKDGSRYRLKFTFTVSNNIVSGLRYTNTVWKTGMKVDSTKVMLGTFSPQKEPYTYELEEEATPAGYFARGSYSAKTKFVDDDGKCYLDMTYYFEIRKDWPTPA
uniref:Rho GDP-dissociation inhibitor 1 n=2 Tax=Musa acuminata subsp. malaccensis TaxID=214687 RepID=A0A804KSA7_MUSAM